MAVPLSGGSFELAAGSGFADHSPVSEVVMVREISNFTWLEHRR